MAITIEGAKFDFSNTGIFGCLRSDTYLICVFVFGLVAGFWGNEGYMIALMFYSEIVVMNCLLLEAFGS